jgi:sugar (pentulose or hexulose) kinase
MDRQDVVLIFDVGKTNKKVLLFDDNYRLVFEESCQFPEIADEDGFPCENVNALTNWVRASFEKMTSHRSFNIKAVNFSAYGASLVYVDGDFEPILPLYNYLKPYPPKLKERFYNQYGGETSFSKQTASPVLGSLNSGMQLYRVKYEKPEVFSKIKYALHLPQYLSSILTGRAYSEITSIGCHTGLWHFETNKYHEWVFAEQVKEKLPPILRSDMGLIIEHGGKYCWVGIGLHDSSAALIPYLTSFHDPFLLLSTGTWCISLNPFNDTILTEQELQKDCLCYLTHQGRPIKASRLFAGNQHEVQTRRMVDYYSVSLDHLKNIQFDSSITQIEIEQLLSTTKRNGKLLSFYDLDLTRFDASEEAYHELMIDIVTRQLIATNLVLKGSDVRNMFVDGGFSKNSIYMNLMAAVFPGIEIFAATVPQASALGAAIAIHKHWNKKPLSVNLVELEHYADATRGGL